jgi:hypothetical protein
MRVIDQDVGQLLGFDPADCSHWKKGKKNIHSIYAMRSLAKYLEVDEALLIDLATGNIDDNEAYYECLGYGRLELDVSLLDKAKKDFFKNNSTWSRDKDQEFKNHFVIDKDQILKVVEKIHLHIKFQEAPLYLPELVAYYPDIILRPMDDDSTHIDELVRRHYEERMFIISFKSGTENQVYARYRIAKMMGYYFLNQKKTESPEFETYQSALMDVNTNLFAFYLLAPPSLIRKEIRKVQATKDICSQLAEVFWVSKAFMNISLRQLLE